MRVSVDLGDATTDRALLGHHDKPGGEQLAQVIGGVRLGDVELVCQLGGAQLRAGEQRQHLQPDRVRQCS